MKSMLLAAAAFLCGAGASYLAFRWNAEPNEVSPTNGAKAEDVHEEPLAKAAEKIPAKDAFKVPVPAGHEPIVLEVPTDRLCVSVCWPLANSRVNLAVIKTDPDTGRQYTKILLESVLVLEERWEPGYDKAGRYVSPVVVAIRTEDLPKVEQAKREDVISLVFGRLARIESPQVLESLSP